MSKLHVISKSACDIPGYLVGEANIVLSLFDVACMQALLLAGCPLCVRQLALFLHTYNIYIYIYSWHPSICLPAIDIQGDRISWSDFSVSAVLELSSHSVPFLGQLSLF